MRAAVLFVAAIAVGASVVYLWMRYSAAKQRARTAAIVDAAGGTVPSPTMQASRDALREAANPTTNILRFPGTL